MNIATTLTLFRVFLGPIFFLVYRYYDAWSLSFRSLPYVLLLVLIIAETSDLLDGYFARKKRQVTDLGKVLDPMADSIFRISVFLTFTQGIIQLPLLLVFVFFYREMVISTLRTVCALKGVALGARWSGKIKAVIQAVVAFIILLLMIPYSLGYITLFQLRNYSFIAVSVAALYTIGSAVEYLIVNRMYIQKSLSRHK